MPLTLDDVCWPQRTERLLIRRARPADAETTYAYRTRPEFAEWTGSVPTDPASWRERYADPAVLGAVLTVELGEHPGADEDPGTIVGEVMVAIRDGRAQREVARAARGVEAEIGWSIAPAHQRRGLALEAAQALLALCFDSLALRRVVADTLEANEPSWRLMERLGMRLESRSRASELHRTRGWSDTREYALLAEEWRARER